MVAAATTALDEPAKESEPSGATETGEGLSLEVPLRAVESMAEAQAPHAEEPTFLVEPLQAVPLGEGSKDLEIISARLSEDGDKTKSKVQAIQASSHFVFVLVLLLVCLFFFSFFFSFPLLFFGTWGFVVMRFLLNE